MRKEVKWFAEEMEKVLKENDFKGGWDQGDLQWLFKQLWKGAGKLGNLIPLGGDAESAEAPRAIIKECIDIANRAMMIADNVKG